MLGFAPSQPTDPYVDYISDPVIGPESDIEHDIRLIRRGREPRLYPIINTGDYLNNPDGIEDSLLDRVREIEQRNNERRHRRIIDDIKNRTIPQPIQQPINNDRSQIENGNSC